MAQKYVNLAEAAEMLGMSEDEVNALRESGDLRGFADRGAWKFKKETIEELVRSRQVGSDPDMPILTEDGDLVGTQDLTNTVDDVGVDDTRKTPVPLADEDSDTSFEVSDSEADMLEQFSGGSSPHTPMPTLAGEEDSGAASDFDLRSTSDGTARDPRPEVEFDNDGEDETAAQFSLAGEDSGVFVEDSGVDLVPEDTGDSGIILDDALSGAGMSDIVTGSGIVGAADDPVSLDAPDSRAFAVDSDVPMDTEDDATVQFDAAIVEPESDVTVEFTAEDGDDLAIDLGGAPSEIVLDTDTDDTESEGGSDITLDVGGGDSDVSLDGDESGLAIDLGGGESGIALDLDGGESGIALDLTGGESGIALDGGESGIALDVGGNDFEGGESGIALDLAAGSDVDFDMGESGLALETGDSAVDTGDSGLALEEGDSGLALDTEDSGLALDFAVDSAVDGASDATQPMSEEIDLSDEDSSSGNTVAVPVVGTSEFDLSAEDSLVEADDELDDDEGLGDLADDSEFGDDEFADDDDFDAADELDELDEVDDFDDADDPFEDDEPASSFDDDDPFEDDSYGAGKKKGAKLDAWGAAASAGLVLCALAMSVTMLITWQSMRVMWTGTAEASLIDPVVDAITGMIQ